MVAAKPGKTGKRPDTSWWQRWPDLLRDELAEFDRLKIPHRITYQAKGVLILEANWPVRDGQSLLLHIGFSALHPFFRPNVAAPNATFERHQDPIGKQLCLLTQDSNQWDPNQRVAAFIGGQLDRLHEAIAARRENRLQDAADFEEHGPDPLMPYYTDGAEKNSVVLFNGHMRFPADTCGMLEIARWDRSADSFEAILTQLRSSTRQPLGETFDLPSVMSRSRAKGRWVRMDPPKTLDATELLEAAERIINVEKTIKPRSLEVFRQLDAEEFLITGIVFEEEVEYGQKGVGWIFVVSRRQVIKGKQSKPVCRVVRGERASPSDLFARLPVANALRQKKVLVVGCGAIGSFVGVELARAGIGELTLVDSDIVQPGNSLRWALGRPVWGVEKSPALAGFIAMNYPTTKTHAISGRVGGAICDISDLPTDLDRKPDLLSQVLDTIEEHDLIIDTAASSELQHALSYFCREMGKPYIMAHATLGAAGGAVYRARPGAPSCWVCLREHWNAGTIPNPPVHEDGMVSPVGCNAPTFTGGGFDLQEISLEVVRSAVGLLAEPAYDPGSWDVAILSLWDGERKRILPSWTSHPLLPHPNCCERVQS